MYSHFLTKWINLVQPKLKPCFYHFIEWQMCRKVDNICHPRADDNAQIDWNLSSRTVNQRDQRDMIVMALKQLPSSYWTCLNSHLFSVLTFHFSFPLPSPLYLHFFISVNIYLSNEWRQMAGWNEIGKWIWGHLLFNLALSSSLRSN